ncbi:hypothetical protein HI914_02161 [Erysiphe necator]|nr:hypothetical protein HI914_02161 [Erysiphe necator]
MPPPNVTESSSKDEFNVAKPSGSGSSKSSDSSHAIKDEKVDSEEKITTEYIKRHFDGYIEYNFTGEQLWEAFVDDFAEFLTADDWQRGDKLITRAFRDMLRSRGVYVIKEKGANTISKRLAELVNSDHFPDWDKNDREYLRIHRIMDDNFQQAEVRDYPTSERAREKAPAKYEPSQAPPRGETTKRYNQPMQGPNNQNWGGNSLGNNVEFGSRNHNGQEYYNNKFSTRHSQLRSPSSSFPPIIAYEICPYTKEISMLERGYPERLKYRGDGDTFDYKFHIFLSRCKQAAIPFDASYYAFSVMLADMPLNYFYAHVDNTPNPSLEYFCNAIKNYFENFEYRRNQQDAWHTLKIDDIINLHPEKSLSHCLSALLQKIDEMKFGLPTGLTNDELVHHKIRSACEDHPALTNVCDRSSSTVHGLVSDLQASAMKYDRGQLKQKRARDTGNYQGSLMGALCARNNHVGPKIIQNMKLMKLSEN